MLVASITDPLVQFAVDVIDKMGLVGVFLLMVGESAFLPIPSEGTMLFAGFNVAEGEYSLLVVTAVGVAANVVGSWIAYGIGYFGRVDLIEKHGRKVFIQPHHLATADPGSRSTATRQCSSRACCRSSGPSSRSRRESRGCRSCASRS